MVMTGYLLAVSLLALIVFFHGTRWRSIVSLGRVERLPPGPPRLPFVGNVFDIPKSLLWIKFAYLSNLYGGILSLQILSQTVIVISSLEIATDLFEKRGAIYSDRHTSVMTNELCNTSWIIAFMKYGDRWRRSRKFYHQHFGAAALPKYSQIQTEKLRIFLGRMHKSPDRFTDHILYVFGATIMKMMFGTDVRDERHEDLTTASMTLEKVGEAAQPGRWLVDIVPPLKYIPEWFPGANFKRHAALCVKLSEACRTNAYNRVKHAYISGNPIPCMATEVLESTVDNPEAEQIETCARGAFGGAFAAGSKTMVAYLEWFFLAMTMDPEIQVKAQKELDAVVGPNRLPELLDRASLPYTEAIFKEVLRWQPVTPLGFLHCTSETDIYKDYIIPKGSIVIGNAWSILRDPVAYPDPEIFKPERFLHKDGSLNPNIRDPRVACFGFGRRICPGRHMAVNALFQVIASVLHTSTIEPLEGSSARDAIPSHTEGFVSRPLPFKFAMKPHSSVADLLLDRCDM